VTSVVSSRQDEVVSTDELCARLGEQGLCVVDARPLPAFNGWRVEGDVRGGHVPGAVAFPASWLARLDDAELKVMLGSKGIATSNEVIVYGGLDAAAHFRGRIEEHLTVVTRVYDEGFTEWAERGLPVEHLPNYRQLVHPAWLRAFLDGGTPEHAPAGRALLFHVNFGVPEEYADSHLPGALFLDTNQLETPRDWQRRSPAELDAALRTLGIDKDTSVILYGRDTEGGAAEKWPGRRAGQIAATRAALILSYCGVEDVRILDGGYDAWVQAGGELETTPRFPHSIAEFGAEIPQHPELIVDIDDARRILVDRHGAALVSVRTWREHIGETSGYNYIVPAGRIAGDVWGNCGTDAYHMQHYRNLDNTMRSYPEIAANWAEAGITADKWVAFYCGTGWRASETWFYAHLMGWSRIAVYDGGWYEWSSDPDSNPIETGDPLAA
jgi:thiosulfate/3-mercaptopyruvate sulfurtransferase